VLVASCQRSSMAYRFCMGSQLADKFRAVQKEMDDCLGYLPLLFQNITYDHHTRLLREILNAVTPSPSQVINYTQACILVPDSACTTADWCCPNNVHEIDLERD
jgi:hypothetical protein